MSKRRNVLLGLAALPTLTAPAALAVMAPAHHADANLLILEAEFLAIDATIEKMSADHPETDLDDVPGYHASEKRRFAVIDMITDLPATSLVGIAAKARVLRTRSVDEDCVATGQLATSMAEDVMRLHAEGGVRA